MSPALTDVAHVYLQLSLLLIYRPRRDERLSWPGWLTYSGWFTHINNGHPSATDRAQNRESSPANDRYTCYRCAMQPVGLISTMEVCRSAVHLVRGGSSGEAVGSDLSGARVPCCREPRAGIRLRSHRRVADARRRQGVQCRHVHQMWLWSDAT